MRSKDLNTGGLDHLGDSVPGRGRKSARAQVQGNLMEEVLVWPALTNGWSLGNGQTGKGIVGLW